MADPHALRSIKGSRALITGAASGMGAATAELFSRAGALVAATDLDPDRTSAFVSQLSSEGVAGLHPFAMDVRDPAAISDTVAEVIAAFGGLDIIVNNAGIVRPGPVDDAERYEEDWAETLSVLLTAQQRVVRAALAALRQSRAPRIVNIASSEGLGATGNNSAYVAAKHGVIGLTRGLAVELGKDAITVNCICPGPIHTGMTAGISEEDKQVYARRRTALRRYGAPEEVAHMTLSLCLPAASFVTGAVLAVDGGLTIRNA
ncbi:MAG: SDR family NAD(P)-dependent oxidoreductase [Pseudomonadota bacterium]